ncbi:MAG: SNF2-related protein [Alloprevotella sp.]
MADILLPTDFAESRALLYFALTSNYLTSEQIGNIVSLFERRRKVDDYLGSWMKKGLVGSFTEVSYKVQSYYYLKPAVWLKVMEEVDEGDLEARIKKLKTVLTESVVLSNATLDFTRSVVLFMKGKRYATYLHRSKLHSCSFNCCDISYPMRVLLHVAGDGEWNVFIASLGEDPLNWVANCYVRKLRYSFCTERDIDFFEKVILPSPYYVEDHLTYFKSFIALHEVLLRKARLQELMADTSLEPVLRLSLENIDLVQRGEYDAAAKGFRKILRDEDYDIFPTSICNFYYGVALLYASPSVSKAPISALCKVFDADMSGLGSLGMLVEIARGRLSSIKSRKTCLPEGFDLESSFMILIAKHFGLPTPAGAKELLQKIKAENFKLLQLEFLHDEPSLGGKAVAKESDMHPSLQPYVQKPAWEETLDSLLMMSTPARSSSKKKGVTEKRLAYFVYTKDWTIEPKVQSSRDGVTWTAGRAVSLERFAKGQAEGMQTVDHAVSKHVSCHRSYGWYDRTYYSFSGAKAIAALVGHPFVFDADTKQTLEVEQGNIQLSVEEKDKNFKIQLNVKLDKLEDGLVVERVNAQKIRVVKVSETQKSILQQLLKLSLPLEAKPKLTGLLENLSKDVTVMSGLLKDSQVSEKCRAHSEIILQMQPVEDEIRCSLFTRPFGKTPPLCTPGKGMEVITTNVDGNSLQTTRNLKREKENMAAVMEVMQDYERLTSKSHEWQFSAAECLDVLERLLPLSKQCKVEWPEGERFKVKRQALTPSSFHLSVGSLAGWFELNGEVEVSPTLKLKMSDLLDRLQQSKGSFIQVSGEEYVRLTSELRSYLDNLSRLATRKRNKVRLSSFHAPMLDSLAEQGLQLDADKGFLDLMQRIRSAEDAEIKIPKNIQADLRSYQKEGYRWMSRLALWGAGALLADDMGLGKTVQSITLLLSRASQGPQLVIVPTSLVLNWRDELTRFAPSLNVKWLGQQGIERTEMVAQSKAYDILIVTYGLLITEEELLQSKEWTTVIMDEAHTIKNRETKMSKAAMQLQAGFRLLLTGTPLQNHISEMWNLMQFANPNLLGSFNEFNERFILPIERDHDKERQQQLRRIISPFILRRTKSEVLSELPQKTEIMRKIDLTPEEWAFYDNIREKALAALEVGENTAIQTLAEITRLRQAACNARLINPKVKIASSKMESFLQLVEELGQSHHRALVFSQFTSHLALVRQELDARGVRYLYLDGATPAKERARLVEEFQHGDMPLFLISLKAGGLGLNLTAADYVIHLDPWWNPAIEDQATDRTYRIGQQRPVTVYRLISSHTIEEKILSLHVTKKNLADALLEGADVSAAMSKEEMLALLREADF